MPGSSQLLPTPQFPSNCWYILYLIVSPFPECHINAIIHYVAFWVCLLLLNIIHWDSSMLLYVLAVCYLLLFDSIPLYEYTIIQLFSSWRASELFLILGDYKVTVNFYLHGFLCVCVDPFFLDRYLGVWSLGHVVCVCLTL